MTPDRAGRIDWFRSLLPPNRTGGSPAHGSPVGGLTSKRIDGPSHGRFSSYTTYALQSTHLPEMMIDPATTTFLALAFLKNASQPHPNPPVQVAERFPVAVFEVLKPAPQERSLYRRRLRWSFLDDHIARKWVSLKRSFPGATFQFQVRQDMNLIDSTWSIDLPPSLRVITIIDIGPITIVDSRFEEWTKYRWLLLCCVLGCGHAPCSLSALGDWKPSPAPNPGNVAAKATAQVDRGPV